MAIHHST